MSAVCIIAGEPSGDALGAPLVEGVRTLHPSWTLHGIGGPHMLGAGLPQSLVPMDDLSVMGIFEVMPRLPKIINHIRKTIEHIEKINPFYVVTIDAPDFSFRVHQGLKKRGVYKGKLFHVVAPTVWAWRAGRAKKIAGFLDGLVCLFPFEPPYFERHGLRSMVMRHPVLSAVTEMPPPIPSKRPSCGLFLGSRKAEIRTHGALFRDCAERLLADHPGIDLIAPTLTNRMDSVRAVFGGLPVTVCVAGQGRDKYTLFQRCDAALAVSGTVGFELAVCGVPHAIAYKMHPISWEMIRRLAKVPYAHLANIILNRRVVPEFLQKDARVDAIVPVLSSLLIAGAPAASIQRAEYETLRSILDHGAAPQAIIAQLDSLCTL